MNLLETKYKEKKMAKKGSCGKSPRVGKVGDKKGRGLGRRK